ncbi:MAG: hypothetical protein HXY50_13790, partial [Ignavibacteriaceae bacterium]|nr:hypothetical protein [Ignavibacteriaceae bacterium]
VVGVTWDKKFLFQSVSSIFLLYFLSPLFKSVSLFGYLIPYPLNFLILFVLIVGCINSINLMDGLDGLVSGFSLLIVSVTFALGYYYDNKFLMILSVSLMGSLIGFLKFNAYPARIFLGDTGSQSLGFFLISAALLSSIDRLSQNLDLTFVIILLGVPIIDTLKVMVIRFVKGKNLFLPDKSHTHYILFGMKIRHKVTVFILQTFSFFYAAAAIYYLRGSEIGGIIMYVILSIPFMFVHKILDIAQSKIHPSYFRDLYEKIPQIFVTVFLKFILPILSLLTLATLVGLIPIKSSIDTNLMLLSIAFILMLLIYSLVSQQSTKYKSDILVFINLIMFLLYSSYSETLSGQISFLNLIGPWRLLLYTVLPCVVFFLFFRERLLQKKVTFLTGIDLIISIFIVLITVTATMLPNSQIMNINVIIFQSFLLYLFYKMITIVKEKLQTLLFYLSFIIPLLILSVLLIKN